MKRLFNIIIVLFSLISAIVILFLALEPFSKGSKQQDSPWLEKAMMVENFIRKGRFVEENGISWKMMPDSTSSSRPVNLYSGAAGVILFYLELYNQTGDNSYLDEAKFGADHLIATLEDSSRTQGIGLYTGAAGIALVLEHVFLTTGDSTYRSGQVLAEQRIFEGSSDWEYSSILVWDGVTDIVYGSAGVGSYLLKKRDDDNMAKIHAARIAVGLLDSAINSAQGSRWKMRPGYERFMDNFSHGTAGITYFISEVYQTIGKRDLLKAAVDGGNWMTSIANEKGYISHHIPGGEDLYYLGWCHGPAGTSQTYYSLFESTRDSSWYHEIIKTGNNLMKEGIDEAEKPGYWNNYGKCCGAVGVAEYYLWLSEVSGEQKYQEYALKMTEMVLKQARASGDTLSWVHAENRVNPDKIAAQAGLMQGSAGFGLWFLKLHSKESGIPYSIHLPDHH